jgi:uncharacterized membrane protein
MNTDDGSIIPLVIGFFMVAALLVTGSIAAGSAFLAQRDLQSVCDGAAIAAGQALDANTYYQQSDHSNGYPLGDVQGAVERYLAVDGGRVQAVASTRDDEVVVVCRQTTPVTFGRAFGYGNGVRQRATAVARPQVIP